MKAIILRQLIFVRNAIYPLSAVFIPIFLFDAFVAYSVNGCRFDPLNSDYGRALDSGYYVEQTSAHQTVIFNLTIGNGVEGEPMTIPADVIEIAWNNFFILAKQQELKPRGDFPGDNLPVPDPNKFKYWIIDMVRTNRLGPMTEESFGKAVKILGLSRLRMQNPSIAKKS